ncbi:substrate-binding domain-containing protein [Paenibacillus soyae]|uniref:Substrate-binding domain-containing protein n=1 Tax=Paenibacillus soyae TaxID=2969249 RepID=A0A9X2MX03_9BACL|nr:substrate-binding domain-containing protein [Paenibacillus soyae]MCR2807902.1 substrate-binding domain-containing protein [Paenibacillus soyae]
MMRKWFILSLCVLAAAVVIGLSSQEIARRLQPELPVILFVPKTTDFEIEFWEMMRQGVMTASEEFGADIRITGMREESDVAGQVALLERAIAEKPDAIVLAATDYDALVPVAQRIADAGITLITVDSGLRGGVSRSFIATDNVAAGSRAAEQLLVYLEPRDKGEQVVAIMNFVKGSATAMERERGVREQLGQEPGILILDTVFSNASEEMAYEQAAALLEEHPDLSGIVALNEPTAIGAARAIEDSGAASRVKLIGFDSSMEEVAYLEKGIIQATIVQKPFNMGYLSVKTAIEALDGRKVKPLIDTGEVVITKANMYDNDKQKLLFPFMEQ